MFRIFLSIFFVFSFIICHSQGLYNNGAGIYVSSGATLYIDGGSNGNYLNATNGTDGKIDINGNIYVEGNWTNNASGGGNVFINIGTNGTVNFVGSSLQTISGTEWTDFESLTLNNSSGAQLGNNSNRVNGTLTLTNGVLDLNDNTLIHNNVDPATVTRTDGFVQSESEDSKFQWNIGANTGTYTYPFGFGSAYIPFIATISAATGSSITVSTWHTSTDNTPYPTDVDNMDGAGGDISVSSAADRFWVTSYTDYTASFRFTYDAVNATNDIGSLTESSLKAQYWNGSIWVNPPVGTNDHGNDNVNSVPCQSAPWVLVDNASPLPVELLEFNVSCNQNKVLVKWITASETNNDYFTLEKSYNSQTWQDIMIVDGAGNSNNYISYSVEDNEELSGITYYRLKQTDFDGAYSYSEIERLNCSENNAFYDITLTPVLIKNELLIVFSANEGDEFEYAVYNNTGALIQNKSITAIRGKNSIIINTSNFNKGIYLITLLSKNNYFGQKIILN